MTFPQDDEEFPCQAMFHMDEETGSEFLMFERPLTQTERMRVRSSLSGRNLNSIWADDQTLCIVNARETD